jgi:putative ATP-dependent endonuclease of OLD family
MHCLSILKVRNFRSCLSTDLQLHDFTPIVGYNNAGKSTILTAIEWLLSGGALSINDFHIATSPIIVEGVIDGIDQSLLDAMPPNQKTAIQDYVVNQSMRIRRTMATPGAAITAKIQVRNPAVTDENHADAWKNNPTGLDGAIKALFPAPIRIQAMENAGDDVGKTTKTNTIGKLIAAITENVKTAHKTHFETALNEIRKRLAADGTERAAELVTLDTETSAQLADLFPGLSLKIEITPPEIPDLFKNGTVQVLENDGHGVARSFDSLGHGAQRCIQMALIRHLASQSNQSGSPKRTLLLIDEPELYLHPQGVEQVRIALENLSKLGYQIIFSTHSPALITRDSAPNAVIVRKNGAPATTQARNPLKQAAKNAIHGSPHQSRTIFELSRAAEVFFSDKILLAEGKTEARLLPPIYERLRGRTLRADRHGLVVMDGSGCLMPAKKILTEMQIDVAIVADFDFAFKMASHHGLLQNNDSDLSAALPILARLATVSGAEFQLECNGLPKKGGKLKPAEAWAAFAADPEGAVIADNLHQKLLTQGIWIWKMGAMEDALGNQQKGEQSIQALELSLPQKSPADIRNDFPAISALLDWFSPITP